MTSTPFEPTEPDDADTRTAADEAHTDAGIRELNDRVLWPARPQDQPRSPIPAIPVPVSKRRRLGLPLVAIIGLALLAAPRVILHDLDIIHEGTATNALFVFLPPVVWIVVVLAARVPNPFVTVLAIGVCYGIFLALGHQLMWGIAFADNPPHFGGNLASLDPAIQAVLLRSFAAVSSLVTGTIVGAITGLVAWGLSALMRRARRPR